MKFSLLALVAMISWTCQACGSGGNGTAPQQPPSGTGDSGIASSAPADATPPAPPVIGTPFGDGTVDARLVNEPGKVVTLDKILVPGKVTIVDFYASWCGACKVMEKKLLEEISGVSGIVVRKIDLVDDVSEAAVHYQVGRALPEMWIFNGQGERVHQLLGGKVADAGKLAKELRAGQ